jgi:eukaryotic-like serine/threonine-protein kinase
MIPERWQRIAELYQSAFACEPANRSVFLRDACAGDEELRREVESLLKQDPSRDGLLESIAQMARSRGAGLKSDGVRPGQILGSYQVDSLIGSGGMGDVYRARDTRLKRDVAIKVLPGQFAKDPARLARAQREAVVLASLNHPHIAQIYELEEFDGSLCLVLEYVDGETLRERLKRGPIPVHESLEIARQIADALGVAHEKGIVHRDLKPANVKVTPLGQVKVLDFGLAKELAPMRLDDSGHPPTPDGATLDGAILGTPAYMSPEQAKGKVSDRRSDIWAFGVILYEMLTGKSAFAGETIVETLSSVLRTDPDWTALPPNAGVRSLLSRCLQKERERRLHDIIDARLEIEDALEEPPVETDTTPKGGPTQSLWNAIIFAAVLAALMVGALFFWTRTTPSDPRPIVRFASTLPLANVEGGLALSRDGSRFAFVGGPQQQIYVRMMNELEARPLAGTDGAYFLSFSPDGEWISFVSGGVVRDRGRLTGDLRLKKVAINGGLPQTLADPRPPSAPALAWGEDSNILFGSANQLHRVSSNGGQAQTVAVPDEKNGERFFTGFQLLPGARAILASLATTTALQQRVVLLNPETGERKLLLEKSGVASFLPIKPGSPIGHILYYDPLTGSLMAVPFDATSLALAGAPVPLLEGVRSITGPYGAFAVSESGTLAYMPGGAFEGTRRSLVWVDRKGTEQPLSLPQRPYGQLRLSPDGERVVIGIQDQSAGRINDNWIYDLVRGAPSRMTSDNFNSLPVWTQDGKRLVWATGQTPQSKLTLVSSPADNSSPPVVLLPDTGIPESISPDGKFVVLRAGDESETLIFSLAEPPSPGKNPRRLLEKQALVRFSPDGQLIAYASSESGRSEIYVQSFPGPGDKWTISTDGGTTPAWSNSGRELFYREGNKLMAVRIEHSPAFRASKPTLLFERRYANNSFGVSPDGMRFLMVKTQSVEQPAQDQLHVIINWSKNSFGVCLQEQVVKIIAGVISSGLPLGEGCPSLVVSTGHVARRRNQSRTLSDRRAAGRRRHGRGLPGA